MDKPIIDLDFIRQEAEKKEVENYRFRDFLKLKDGKKLDAKVFELNEKISESIDCTKCGNCCKSLIIGVAPHEIENLKHITGLEEKEIKEQYLEIGSFSGQMILNKIPCRFLVDKKCSHYEHRFTDCREFPHLHHENFMSRLFSVIDNYSICPIVYNLYESLKKAYDFV